MLADMATLRSQNLYQRRPCSYALTLVDLFGQKEAEVANQLIDSTAKEVIAEVRKRIAEKVKDARQTLRLAGQPHRKVDCPACGTPCGIVGEVVRRSDPRLENDTLYWEEVILPTHLNCLACGLHLNGLAELHSADLDEQFTILESTEAREYYMADFDPMEYYGPEYMNS